MNEKLFKNLFSYIFILNIFANLKLYLYTIYLPFNYRVSTYMYFNSIQNKFEYECIVINNLCA